MPVFTRTVQMWYVGSPTEIWNLTAGECPVLPNIQAMAKRLQQAGAPGGSATIIHGGIFTSLTKFEVLDLCIPP